jgi:hypothetical protein
MRSRRKLEVVAGRVNADGSIAAGDGFSVNKTGTGLYVITLIGGFRLLSLIVIAASGNARIVSTQSYTGNSAQVNMFTTAAATVDDAFAFSAMGIQQ